MRHLLTLFAAVALSSGAAFAGTITIGGDITQSTADGTGPAGNNSSLNSIADNDAFSIAITFPGSIAAPGMFTGTSLVFSDAAASASESAFGAITLTVTTGAGVDTFSLLGCLTTGSGCAFGDELTANFSIPGVSLTGTGVGATGLDQPHPMDLLEDDGTTDIQGSISSYSYSGAAAPAPEPATWGLIGVGFVVFELLRRKRSAHA